MFFVLLLPDKLISFTGRPNAIGLSSQLSCLLTLLPDFKKKDTVSCVCVCVSVW